MKACYHGDGYQLILQPSTTKTPPTCDFENLVKKINTINTLEPTAYFVLRKKALL